MFKIRRKNLAKHILEAGKEAVLISTPSNLYYYTGFTGGDGMFFMNCAKMKESAKGNDVVDYQGYLITDSRYYEQVERECPDVVLVRLEKSGYSEIVKQILSNGLCRIVAVEAEMKLAHYLKLQETCKNISFEMADATIMQSRMVKDAEELQQIAQAEAIGDAAFSYILDVIKPGMTEREIGLELEFFMKRQGASKLSFDTIIASGSNSSMPHAQVTDRRIEKGDFITMDFGCVYQGYCSDMTRTIAVGEPTQDMKKIYQIVLEANQRAMEGIQEGIICNVIDALARDYIKEQGYGGYFGHGLGHGVGLDIHEEPRFSPKCDVVMQENMVITNEPGIYLPGQFGVRIEDLIVVKKDGYQKLSNSDTKLIIL